MGVHEPRHVGARDPAVGKRAVELALLGETSEFAPKPPALAPTFYIARNPSSEPRAERRPMADGLEVTRRSHGVPLRDVWENYRRLAAATP
jgi:hypothetical protein